MLKLTTIIAISAALLTGLITERASAYQFFSDRDTWNNALSGKSIITENFNSVPDSFIAFGTTFPSGVQLVDSGFLGGAAVSKGALQVGLAFPGSTDEFAFPTAVQAFGFDLKNVETGDYSDKLFRAKGIFGLSGVLPNDGFFGVVADAGELIAEFQILGSGEIGKLAIDNLSFAPSVAKTQVPESGSIVGLGVLGCVLLLRRNKV